MTAAALAVALLFDDAELGRSLREALQEKGARIVHEGGVAGLDRELLQRMAADVLVVNLDDAADEALDRLYEMVDGDRPRMVFNDAQASRGLIGWDHARWLRHLTVKVLAAGDIDPPRPAQAPLDEPVAAYDGDMARTASDAFAGVGEPASSPVHVNGGQAASDAALPPTDELSGGVASAESENLAAELEALLASGDLPVDDEVTGSGLRFADGDALPPLHDGHFGEPVPTFSGAEQTSKAATPTFNLDHLQLAPMGDGALPPWAGASSVADAVVTAVVRAPDGWSLLDQDSAVEMLAPMETAETAMFDVGKMGAADFPATAAEGSGREEDLAMKLELQSIEQALAPQARERVSEMHLDDFGATGLQRLVLLGATADGIDSLCAFLSALPTDCRLTFLHTQHAGEQPLGMHLEEIATHSALPVRLASDGGRARAGEVLVVPEETQVVLRRDGRIEVSDGEVGPAIDVSFSMGANAFGSDALAIVFAGRANDAVAGAQAVYDRGGQVWVESSSSEYFSDMVSVIFAERLAGFSGTPRELAAHLVEVFP
jgi:two-component system chemotaxis response regulator CheB/chemosensory pili system protein ChpB (putative protein-glutamate methylesterase)